MGYSVPGKLSDALDLLSGGDVKIVAGCTDFFPMLGEQPAPPKLLDVSSLSEMRGIARTKYGWNIGASTTWTDIVNAPLPPAFDGLKSAAREVGSIQIQNAGTVAGNLCNASPAADGVPPLLTLNATLELRSASGSRVVALSDFITGVRRIDLRPDELVYAIHIPDMAEQTNNRARSSFLKLGSRTYLVISIAMVAALVTLDDAGRIAEARVAVGACSAVAQRLGALETALRGQNADQVRQSDIWAHHLAPLSPIADVRGSADYRLDAAAELCRRVVLDAMAEPKGDSNG